MHYQMCTVTMVTMVTVGIVAAHLNQNHPGSPLILTIYSLPKIIPRFLLFYILSSIPLLSSEISCFICIDCRLSISISRPPCFLREHIKTGEPSSSSKARVFSNNLLMSGIETWKWEVQNTES